MTIAVVTICPIHPCWYIMLMCVLSSMHQFKRVLLHSIKSIISSRRFGVNTFDNECFEFSLIKPDLGKKYGDLHFSLLPSILDHLERYCSSTTLYKSPGEVDSSEYRVETSRKESEHYILLPAIIEAINCQSIVEIGTFRGASAYSILSNTTARLTSFDIVPYSSFNNSLVQHSWVDNGRFVQYIADLSDSVLFKKYLNILIESPLIFLDAPKDGVFEQSFLSLLFNSSEITNKYILIDDINVSTMVSLWNSIPYEKIDLSFIGHWSGTGLVYIP